MSPKHEKAPVRPGAYIFFIDEHFTNLPLASRQCLAEDFIGGHFVNLPLASRHCLAEAIPPLKPLMKTQAIAAAIRRIMNSSYFRRTSLVAPAFLSKGGQTCEPRSSAQHRTLASFFVPFHHRQPFYELQPRAELAVLHVVHDFAHDERAKAAQRFGGRPGMGADRSMIEAAAVVFDLDGQCLGIAGNRHLEDAFLAMSVLDRIGQPLTNGNLDIVEGLTAKSARPREGHDIAPCPPHRFTRLRVRLAIRPIQAS
ncbi:MAG: hypothetical protein ABSB70_01750 [Candidatus Velthaea sp.]